MGKFVITGNYIYKNCRFCNFKTTATNLPQHERCCYLNPKNKKYCPVCGNPIKNWKKNTTCSTSCGNTYFRSGKDNPNYGSYRTICFDCHGKKCLICDEELIVAAHHHDGDKCNNNPINLLPLCPTHHTYWHSKYRYLIEYQITDYMYKLSGRSDLN